MTDDSPKIAPRIPFCATLALLLPAACYVGPGDGDGSGDGDGGSSEYAVPDIPDVCEGFDAQDVSQPDALLQGADCNEDAIRAAVEAGGVVRVECPDAPVVFTSEMVVTADTVLDGGGVTVLDGGGSTRLLNKISGPTLYLQNITLQNAQAPEALGNAEVTQANWYDWAGGAVLAKCSDTDTDVVGAVYGKNLVCRNNATGSHTRDPNTGQILDTGMGGCLFSFTCRLHCDECEFTDNVATNGGAIGTLGGKTLLTHSAFVGNRARFDASTNDNQAKGGAYYQDGTETAPGEDEVNYVHMCGNYFAGNEAELSGGAINMFWRQGTNTSFAFLRNACEGNWAEDSAGCLWVYVDPDTKIDWAPDTGTDEFIVSSNAFIENSGANFGGGATIFNIWDTAARFDNNLFIGNELRGTDQSQGGGGALGLLGAYFDLEHNTFAFNRANNWLGGVAWGSSEVELRNNLFYENSAPTTPGGEHSATEHVAWPWDAPNEAPGYGGNLYYPTVTPWGEQRKTPGPAVVDRDPMLGELVRGDAFPYYLPLDSGSPAIDAGIGLPTVDVDMRGQSRGEAPDIGAYEVGG